LGPRKNNFLFFQSRLQVYWPDLGLHLILAFSLKRGYYSSGFAAADRTNLIQIRAPKMRKLFLREPLRSGENPVLSYGAVASLSQRVSF
jgi:hypothetical protein